jgi:hypothetical protein
MHSSVDIPPCVPGERLDASLLHPGGKPGHHPPDLCPLPHYAPGTERAMGSPPAQVAHGLYMHLSLSISVLWLAGRATWLLVPPKLREDIVVVVDIGLCICALYVLLSEWTWRSRLLMSHLPD